MLFKQEEEVNFVGNYFSCKSNTQINLSGVHETNKIRYLRKYHLRNLIIENSWDKCHFHECDCSSHWHEQPQVESLISPDEVFLRRVQRFTADIVSSLYFYGFVTSCRLLTGWKSTTSSGARRNKSCTLNNVLTSMNLHVYVLNLLPPLSLKNQLCSGSCSVSADRNGISVIFYHARKHSFLCCSAHHPALPCLHFSVCLFISFLLKWGFRPNHGISMISHAFNLRKQFCACVCRFVVLFLGNLRIWVSHGVARANCIFHKLQKKLNLPGL